MEIDFKPSKKQFAVWEKIHNIDDPATLILCGGS